MKRIRLLDVRTRFKPQVIRFQFTTKFVMIDFVYMYICNFHDAGEEENRSLSYEMIKVLTATNMTIRCLPPKMVLLCASNRMP